MKHCGVHCGPYWTRRLGKKKSSRTLVYFLPLVVYLFLRKKRKKSLRSSSKVSITVQDKGLLLQGDCYPALIIIFSEEASLFQLWTPSFSVMDAFFLLLLVTDYCKVGSDTLFENHSKCRIWSFEFWHFPPIFVLLKLTCLITLFDLKLQIFKNSPKWTIIGMFN